MEDNFRTKRVEQKGKGERREEGEAEARRGKARTIKMIRVLDRILAAFDFVSRKTGIVLAVVIGNRAASHTGRAWTERPYGTLILSAQLGFVKKVGRLGGLKAAG